jgi:putative tryptophan/tyrosine transport system substrate-binding protein
MNRRVFIGTLAGGLLAAPLAAERQQAGKTARAGNLFIGPQPSPEELAKRAAASPLWIKMKELGWVEGQNLVVERRYAETEDQARPAAAELVRLKLDVVIAWSASLAKLLTMETSTIPIVVVGSGPDLVTRGLVASLARPGGNLTGLQILSDELISKRFDLLRALVPSLSRVAFLTDASVGARGAPPGSYLRQATLSAQALGVELHPFRVPRPEDLPAAFRSMTANRDNGLLVAASPFMFSHRKQLAELAALHRIPAIHEYREYLDAGGLISYGVSVPDLQRRCAIYLDKILRGAKPGDLPIEQPTKFELVINLKTAKALGLTIPPSLLQRADQVIE